MLLQQVSVCWENSLPILCLLCAVQDVAASGGCALVHLLRQSSSRSIHGKVQGKNKPSSAFHLSVTLYFAMHVQAVLFSFSCPVHAQVLADVRGR